MKLPANAVPVVLDNTLGDLTADRAAQIAGRIAQRRGAAEINVTVVDDNGHEVVGSEIRRSPSPTFRVQAIALFPKRHTVVGSTHPIERADRRAHSVERYPQWQIAACADLIAQFEPLTAEEATACQNV